MAKKKDKVGRPTDYSNEILVKARHYLSNFRDYGDIIPSVAGLASHLHIARSTVYDWAKQEDKKEFSDILDDILSDQEKLLLNKGLSGEFNAQITKLVLGKHGYKESSESDVNIKSVSLTELFNGESNGESK